LAASNSLTYTDVGAASSNQGVLADTAWQNPASATNWGWTSDGVQITLTNYTGPTNVVIPDMLDGLPVTGIGAQALWHNANLTSVIGGNNIKNIGSLAFDACSSLSSVALQCVTSVTDFVFQDCTALASITIPQVTQIGEGAFYGCVSLSSITIPQVTQIGEGAFAGCTSLTAVVYSQNAPSETTNVYSLAVSVTNYVTNPTATGWGATWNGRPVVRLPLYGSGVSLTGVLHPGDSNTNLFNGAGYTTGTPWTVGAASSNLLSLVANGTCSIPYNASAPASDQQFYIYLTTAITFTVTTADWPTNRAHSFVLDYYSVGSQIVWSASTMLTNLMASSNNCMNHSVWSKGVGHTNFVGAGYAW
jgi:hypothetical protein